ncbi:hypothetical protein GCM10007981_03520 [Thermocladium modestius]|uniref:Uncharacterized protein n=1 Tax=Thermocladium modestius TaxID=62609 RepID=A0A830GRG1_9CREN|nr:hypothetical protein [Thermocladium modestius]GGP19517.1 hypothetical protein GCM10007981_03520 [Thermocladium modestius]
MRVEDDLRSCVLGLGRDAIKAASGELELAEQDLRSAELLLNNKAYSHGLLMLQQYAERVAGTACALSGAGGGDSFDASMDCLTKLLDPSLAIDESLKCLPVVIGNLLRSAFSGSNVVENVMKELDSTMSRNYQQMLDEVKGKVEKQITAARSGHQALADNLRDLKASMGKSCAEDYRNKRELFNTARATMNSLADALRGDGNALMSVMGGDGVGAIRSMAQMIQSREVMAAVQECLVKNAVYSLSIALVAPLGFALKDNEDKLRRVSGDWTPLNLGGNSLCAAVGREMINSIGSAKPHRVMKAMITNTDDPNLRNLRASIAKISTTR